MVEGRKVSVPSVLMEGVLYFAALLQQLLLAPIVCLPKNHSRLEICKRRSRDL